MELKKARLCTLTLLHTYLPFAFLIFTNLITLLIINYVLKGKSNFTTSDTNLFWLYCSLVTIANNYITLSHALYSSGIFSFIALSIHYNHGTWTEQKWGRDSPERKFNLTASRMDATCFQCYRPANHWGQGRVMPKFHTLNRGRPSSSCTARCSRLFRVNSARRKFLFGYPVYLYS